MTGIDICDVRITLSPEPYRPEVLANASFLVAGLCVRGISIVKTWRGSLRVVFPDAPAKADCEGCAHRIPVTHRYCHHCGRSQPKRVVELNHKGVPQRYLSVVFPLTTEVRDRYEAAILAAYSVALSEAELAPAKAS